ncbi:MAG: hypothetical protein KKF88_01630 [Alphaproteobacteria bacterium]|nr:hypothetical protein [Alphaproteobacteria bacterium]
MTVIDINEMDPSWVKLLRADGLSDAEILEFGNAPEVASCIDEVPAGFRVLFSDGETDSEILDCWNHDPEPWLKIDLDRVAPEGWLDWKRREQGMPEREIQQEFHEAGGKVPDLIVNLLETSSIDGLAFSHHLRAYSGNRLCVGANLTDDGRYIWVIDEEDHFSPSVQALLETLNWLRTNASGRWTMEGLSDDGERGAVWLSFIDESDYLKASEMLAPKADDGKA